MLVRREELAAHTSAYHPTPDATTDRRAFEVAYLADITEMKPLSRRHFAEAGETPPKTRKPSSQSRAEREEPPGSPGVAEIAMMSTPNAPSQGAHQATPTQSMSSNGTFSSILGRANSRPEEEEDLMERASSLAAGVGEEEDLEAQAVDSESDFEASASSSVSGASTRTKSLTTSKGPPKATKPIPKSLADQEQTRKKTLDAVAQLGAKKTGKPSNTTIIRNGKAVTDVDNMTVSAITAGALNRVLATVTNNSTAAPTDQGNGYPPPGPATGTQEERQTSSGENY